MIRNIILGIVIMCNLQVNNTFTDMNDIIDEVMKFFGITDDNTEDWGKPNPSHPDRFVEGEDYAYVNDDAFPEMTESRMRFLDEAARENANNIVRIREANEPYIAPSPSTVQPKQSPVQVNTKTEVKSSVNRKPQLKKQTSIKIGKNPELNRDIALKMIWNLENPRMKGRRIVDGQERFYPIHEYDKKKGIDTWSLGPGLDLVYGVLKGNLEKYKSQGMSRKEVEDIAYKELNRHAKAVYDAFVDRGLTTRPDTISHGVIMNAAQTRYHLGNIIDRMGRFGRAAIKGSPDRMYRALTNDNNLVGDDRMNKMKTYDPYLGYGGWHSQSEREGKVKK